MDRDGSAAISAMFLYLIVVAMIVYYLCGCGPQPDYTTRHGIDVFEQGATADKADVEEITRVALELWPTSLDGVVLRLRPEPIRYAGDPNTYTGTFAEGTMTVWAACGECFAESSYGHEVLHTISWRETGDADRRHTMVGPLDRVLRKLTIPEMCDNGVNNANP